MNEFSFNAIIGKVLIILKHIYLDVKMVQFSHLYLLVFAVVTMV